MVLRDIYNVVGVAAQDTFFSEMFSIYEVINANTETQIGRASCRERV